MESRQRTDQPTTDRRKRPEQAAEEVREPKYHVYIRLPFNRGDFVDPGTVSFALCFSRALIMADPSVKGELEREEIRGALEHPVRFAT